MKNQVLTLLLSTALVHPALAAERELEQVLEVEGEKAFSIDAAVGSIDLAASDDGKIHILVTVEPANDLFKADADDIAAIELDIDRGSSRIEAELDLPRGLDSDDIKVHWEVKMPVSLEADIDLGVGELQVSGISGGLSASVGVGEVTVEVPEGQVDVSVGVGEAKVTQSQASIGVVRVDSSVGDARVRINGERVSSDSRFIGERVKYRGEGDHDVDVTVKVGSARVDLEAR